MLYVAMMICRLFGKKSPTHFSVEWVAITNEVAKGYTLNWAKEMFYYKIVKSKGHPTPFYMSPFYMFHLLHDPFSLDKLELDPG